MARDNLQKALRRERQWIKRHMAWIERMDAANKRRHAIYMKRARLAGVMAALGAFDSEGSD